MQAITHDSRNYVVDADKCNSCMACISPCPTGSIDNWRTVPLLKAYSLHAQLGWDELPGELTTEQMADAGVAADAMAPAETAPVVSAADPSGGAVFNSGQFGATLPPWSAAHAYANLYGPKAAQKTIAATVTGNVRVTEVGRTAGHDLLDGAVRQLLRHAWDSRHVARHRAP